MPLESKFKTDLIRKIKREFPGAIILKNNANLIQGFPDNIILFEDRWAVFDAKRSATASHRPNQDYWIDLLNNMSYGSFVYPENEGRFLHELQQALRPDRRPRLFVSV